MEALVFILVGAVAAGAVYLAWYLRQQRIKELASAAIQLGLEFSRSDPFGTLSEPFQLFRKGDGQGVENVMWGTWQGMEVRQFDFWYYEESDDSKGGRSRTYYRFNCALSPIQA